MSTSLSSETQRMIEECVERGGYASADDAVRAGLESLCQSEAMEQFAPGELDRLLEEGENSGPPLDGDQVLSELKALRASSQSV